MEPKTRVAKVINKADKTTTVRHGTVESVDGDTVQVLIDNTASPTTCARACVCVQGDRVVVVGKDAIATVGANYGSGGGGSIASTTGLLAGDGSGNAIAADPASMFVLEQYVVINGVSTANNGVAENTVTESKAGYYPLAIAGWTSNNRYPNVYGCRLTAQSVGSASIFCGASNFSGSTRTLTVSAVVLWVKVN